MRGDPMPDQMALLKALAGAAGIPIVLVLLCGLPWRKPYRPWAAFGSVLGVALGFYAGCFLLGLRPRWPPLESQDRLLFLLLPAVIAVEIAGAFAGRFHWTLWLPRLLVAALLARVLLHNSIYLEDLAGPDSREWTPTETWLILGGLATALMSVWAALVLLAKRVPGRSAPLAVAVVCVGAALTVMLSGSATG